MSYADICPAVVKILKYLLGLGSLSLQPDLVRLPCESYGSNDTDSLLSKKSLQNQDMSN